MRLCSLEALLRGWVAGMTEAEWTALFRPPNAVRVALPTHDPLRDIIMTRTSVVKL